MPEIQHYINLPLCEDLDNTLFIFALENNLTLEFLQVDNNNMPEFKIKGTKQSLEKFIDTIYDSGIKEENNYIKSFIMVLE